MLWMHEMLNKDGLIEKSKPMEKFGVSEGLICGCGVRGIL
ncbi:hypothetical protein FACS1894187_22290 [Synergistales bacterium]|nr:hypothetical protein FACS1894187_22290 [Synergistales bacterium]